MVDLMGIDAAWRASQGDMGPLLDRLRACDLTPDEKAFIEGRLTGTVKLSRGPKRRNDTCRRTQEIIVANEWLKLFTVIQNAPDRVNRIAGDIGRDPKVVREALKARQSVMTRWTLEWMRVLAFSGHTATMPRLLKETPTERAERAELNREINSHD